MYTKVKFSFKSKKNQWYLGHVRISGFIMIFIFGSMKSTSIPTEQIVIWDRVRLTNVLYQVKIVKHRNSVLHNCF